MSAHPDYSLGDLDGEDELSDQEPHELTSDHGVTEDPKEVHEEENSIDGIPTNLKNVWAFMMRTRVTLTMIQVVMNSMR